MLRHAHITSLIVVLQVGLFGGCADTLDQNESSAAIAAEPRQSRPTPTPISQDHEALEHGAPIQQAAIAPVWTTDGAWEGVSEAEANLCGNGVIDLVEECDDSNANVSDGCDTCRLTGAHEIFFEIHGAPARAERLFITIDGGGLSEPIVDVEPITPNGGITHALTPLGAGGPYRARLLAVTGEGTPVALAGGLVEDIDMAFGEAMSAVVELSRFEVDVEEETPESVSAGDVFLLHLAVHDPAAALEGYRWGRIWYGFEPFEDLAGERQTGYLLQSTASEWDLTAEVTTQGPNMDRSLFYQFGQPLEDFRFKEEIPALVFPSSAIGDDLFSVDVTEAVMDVTVVVSSIPIGADRIVVTVDRGAGSTTLFEIEGAREGRLQEFQVQIPAGTGYRVRAIALADESPRTSIVAGGVRDSLAIPRSGDLEFNIRLSAFEVEADSDWPDAVESGSVHEIEFTVHDPSDLLVSRETVAAVWSMSGSEREGSHGRFTGELWEVGPGEYAGRILWSVPNVSGVVDVWLGLDDWWDLDELLLFQSSTGVDAPLFSVQVD